MNDMPEGLAPGELPPELPPELAEMMKTEAFQMMEAEMFTRGMQRAEEAGLISTIGEGDEQQVVLTQDGLCVGAVLHSMLERQATRLFVPGRD
jgi:hypothetical protein